MQDSNNASEMTFRLDSFDSGILGPFWPLHSAFWASNNVLTEEQPDWFLPSFSVTLQPYHSVRLSSKDRIVLLCTGSTDCGVFFFLETEDVGIFAHKTKWRGH